MMMGLFGRKEDGPSEELRAAARQLGANLVR